MPKPDDTFHRDASNRLTFDIYKVESSRYPRLCKELETEFCLKPASELVVGLDEMFRDYTDGKHIVGPAIPGERKNNVFSAVRFC